MRTTVRLAPLALALLLAACARTPVKPAPAPAPPPPQDQATIRLEHLAPGAGWRVTWRLPRPVSEVRFSRAGGGDRQRHWKITTPGLVLATVDGEDRLLSPTGPFTAFEAVVTEYARKPEKDYQVFIPFTDGTVLAYTGAFDVQPPRGDWPFRLAFELVPRRGEAVVVGGARSPGPATWKSRGDGTYAAFGNTALVETPLGLAVVDGGLPPWLRERTLSLAPRIFAHYALRTGWQLDERPVFLLSFGRAPDPGSLSFGGGSLAGVVQLDARLGSRYATGEDPTVWERQARLLAHEAAHLWLDQAFRPAEGAGHWLDEGGADAWSLRALADLGVISRERLREILIEDLGTCMGELEAGPLVELERAGRWRAVYTCGEVASFLAEAAGARRDPPWNLLQFWGQVFFYARDRVYDESLWLDTLSGMVTGDRAATTVRRMLTRPDAALPGEVAEMLRVSE